jgi:hypothetical protein
MAAPARKLQSLPSPAELLDLIAQRKGELPALLKAQNEAAERSVSTNDETEYRAAVDAVVAANRDVERLQQALIGATARNREQAEAAQRAAQAAVRERVGKLLDQRTAIVTRIENAISELVGGWRELIALSDKAHAAYPNGPPPIGLALSNGELIQLVGAELYRLGGVVPVTGTPQLGRMVPTLPGPKCPDYMLIHQPEKITKLSVAIEQANALARSVMENKQQTAA